MRAMGLRFTTAPAHVDEEALDTGNPSEDAIIVARAKAERVALRRPKSLIIGADTMVVLDGRVLGKPASRGEAREFLKALSGRAHDVMTGLCLIHRAEGARADSVVITKVVFRRIAPHEIEAYLDTPDPYDKAGAYGIQSGGGAFVDHIEGDYFNVVGLPLERLRDMLAEFLDVSGLILPPAPPGIQRR